ncbi:MAG: hypothetical protein VB144_00905 [Clostridia bacterium]|nr:hypothetical protein [Clostridia bacterium]
MNQSGSRDADDLIGTVLDIALSSPDRCVGVVGLAKNCGKTTVLASLVRSASARRIRVGVTSCGRDGELYDAITGLPKPAIQVSAGTVVALAESTLNRTSSHLEVLERLGVHTTAGEIVVARAMGRGPVEIIGCNHSRDLIASIAAMRSHGAELILVDGAAGRTFLASPDVVGSFVLSTGAALDGEMREVADATEMAVHLFTLPPPPPELSRQAEAAIRAGQPSIIRSTGVVQPFPWRTLLGRESEIVALLNPDDMGLAYDRAIGDALLAKLAEWLVRHSAERAEGAKRAGRAGPNEFVVVGADPARVAAGERSAREFEAAGGTLSVLRRASVVAISTNPTSPSGVRFDPREFTLEVSRRVPNLLVFDVAAGLSALGGAACEA